MAVNWKEKLRELLSAAEAEPDEADEIADEADEIADEADEIADESGAADEADEIADEADEIADEAEDGPGAIEGTPGVDETGEANEADLRATIIEQAALIETYRNQLAAAGIVFDDVESDGEIADEIDDIDEDDVVAAFDKDYAEREALLEEIRKG